MTVDVDSEWDCFIAYPGPQRVLAQQLADVLAPRLRVYLDQRELHPGDDWPQALAAALDVARVIAVIVAPETDRAYYEREEIVRAIDRARAPGSDRRVVPIFVGGVTPSDARIPYGLRTKQGLTIALPGDVEKAAEAIATLAAETAANADFDAARWTDSRVVSPTVRQHLSQLRIDVEQLTKEQYRAIQQLRYMRRVRISGCAGSGKTLVATEKAIRLANAGRSVLFLCHNPLLAEHVHHLTAGTGVEVRHFAQLVQELTEPHTSRDSTPWTHFDEPDQQSLNRAFEVLTKGLGAFDAIIVDEGQDFREEWWSIVEAGLSSSATGLLYIFHDNNQSLLPYRGHYPIADPHVDLSRNCRNAGRVFELMRRFDNSAPEPELALRTRGRVLLRQYEPGTEALAIAQILATLDREELLKDTVVIVATEGSLHDSTLAGCEISIAVTDPWQDVVRSEFSKIIHMYDDRGVLQPNGGEGWIASELTQLSQEPYPSEADVDRVRRVARAFSVAPDIRTRINESPLYRNAFKWHLVGRTPRLRRNARGAIWASEVILQFERLDWAHGLPRPKSVVLQPFYLPLRPGNIPLYRVADFKGLEAEAVVLVLRGRISNQREATYVGVSRARALLCVLSDQSALSAFPRTFLWDP